MVQVSSNDGREQVLRHLLESRRLYGAPLPGDVMRAAQVCGVSRATIYRWLRKESASRISRPSYSPSEEDKVAVFTACGNLKLAYEIRRIAQADVPSFSTFRRGILEALDAATLAAAKHGVPGRDAVRMTLMDRSYRRNERWEGDHTQLEVVIVADHREQPVRPWLTWIIDAGSRYVVAWAISTERPTRGTVLATIRVGVLHEPNRGPVHGRPEMLVWDNGLEFTANAVTEAGARLGSQTINTYPYSPSKKPKIERINQSIERELLQRLPHYTRGPKQKDGSSYFAPSDYLTLDQLVHEVDQWILNYNQKRGHSSLGGKTPEASWLSDPTPVVAVPATQVHHFTLEHLERKVRRDGGVHVDGVAYTSPELLGLEGKTVGVGRIPYDKSCVEIFRHEEWICSASPTASLNAAQVDEFLSTRNSKNMDAARLRRKATRQARIAPLTASEPNPRLLTAKTEEPQSSRRSAAELFDLSRELGEVE